MEKPELSWEIFHVISTILARFIKIRKECGISMSELYVLAYIKHFGRTNPSGEKLVLRADITQLLGDVFNYKPKRVTSEVTKLRNKRCIKEHTLEADEKRAIYGIDTGQMRSVVLLEKGYEKIDDFTIRIHQVYLDLTGPFLSAAFGQDERLIKSIAEWLLIEKKELEGLT
jgi:DNA-binding MarR family transcriptional regulator